MGLPYLKFYPSNWRADAGVRSSSLAARGFWVECLFLMHGSSRRGYLLLQDRQPSDRELAVQVGATLANVRRYRRELLEKGVAEHTPDGVLFSRKMVRDEIRRRNGAKGGNPALTPGDSDNQEPPTSVNRKPPPSVNRKRRPRITENASFTREGREGLEDREDLNDDASISSTSTPGTPADDDVTARASTPVPTILAHWRTAWERRWPGGILDVSPAEAGRLERLAVRLGDAECRTRIDQYLATEDTWLEETMHPLPTFIRQVNRYRAAAAAAPARGRTGRRRGAREGPPSAAKAAAYDAVIERAEDEEDAS